MLRQYSPALFMLSSTLSLSISGLLSKYLAEQVTPEWLVFLRFLLPAIVLFFVLSMSKIKRPSKDMLKPLLTRSACISVCQMCFIYALTHLSLVESVVLFGTGPLFIPVLEKLIFSTPMRRVSIFSLLLTFAGVLLLSGSMTSFSFRPALLVGLAAGIFNAGSQLSLYRATKGAMSPVEINVWTFTLAALWFLPTLTLSPMFTSVSAVPVDGHGLGLLVLCFAVLSGLIINTQVFRAKAFKLAESGSQLAPLIFTNLLFTSLWQVLFFNVRFDGFQLGGLALIVFANVVNVFTPLVWRKLRPHQLLSQA